MTLLRLSIGLLIFLQCSCSNDFTITAPYQERIIVTGILDVSEQEHYIKIQKAFISEGETPQDLAADTSNRFFEPDELEVWVERRLNGNIIDRYNFEYIKADTAGITKEEGFFPISPNILYRYQGILPDDGDYVLKVYRITEHDTLSASTLLVGDFKILFPVANQFGINFTDTGKLTYAATYALNARIYDLVLRLHYREWEEGSTDTLTTFKDWVIFENVLGDNANGNGTVAFEIRANTFYGFIRAAFEDEPFKRREVDRLSYRVIAGGTEMYLLYLNNIAGLGLNELYATPLYTNIENGYGIFSSRRLNVVDSVQMSPQSVDFLACDSTMNQYGFVPSLTHPFYPDCE